MAELAGAFAVSHILFDGTPQPEQAERVFQGYSEVGRRVRGAEPDLVVMISGDHMLNIDSGVQVPFGVGTADEWTAFGDMGTPRDPRPGHRAFGEGLVRFLAKDGFDVAKLEGEGFHPDHGYSCPMLFNDPEHRIPLVPIHININMDPVPSVARCWQFGALLRRYVAEAWPAGQRVVIEATGGLSHWLMIERDGETSEEFDNWVLDRFAAADVDALRKLTVAEIFERAGNGGLEILFWLALAGAAGDFTSAERIFYAPMWKTGLGGIALNLA